MISVILIWVYVLLITYCIGVFALYIVRKCMPYEINDNLTLILSGIVGVTVYAQVFSLFYRVALLANILLCLISIAIVIIFKNDFKNYISSWLIFNTNKPVS